ncbi:MAG: class I SAM-dependent methyltransferase [Edaphobacter sp.]
MGQMPVSAIEHYETFLASHYTWMSGPYEDKVAAHQSIFTRFGFAPGATGEALDLASGPGCQTLALARLGFSVTAVDASSALLDELRQHAGHLPVRTVEQDLCALAECGTLPNQVDVAVCMGDILPHLPSRECITNLFAEVNRRLVPGGKFILSFRDLSQELFGVDRFIPIRGDSDRVMTCFLEFEPETVIVHDLIHVREGEGWTLHKSAYRKLRLSLAWVEMKLRESSFELREREQASGVWAVVAEKM